MFFSKKRKDGTGASEHHDEAAKQVGAGAASTVATSSATGMTGFSNPVGATADALATAGAAALAANHVQAPMMLTEPGASPVSPAQSKQPGLTAADIEARREKARITTQRYGAIVSVLARSTPYQSLALSELRYLALPPMATGQFLLADGLIDQSRPDGPFGPVAVVTWALVSPEVDRALLENPNAPFRLFIPDYKSGDIPWIIEAAGRKPVVDKLITQLLEREFKGRPVKVRVRAADGSVTAMVYNSPPPPTS